VGPVDFAFELAATLCRTSAFLVIRPTPAVLSCEHASGLLEGSCATRPLKRIAALANLPQSPAVSGMFQVTITVKIVAKTTSKPIALRCVFGFSIFFSSRWPAGNALRHRKMHADACAADGLHLPVVRPCSVR